ncbi:MAG: RNA pseudouridine synthase [Phycisphaerales bacterium]|nr:MAG: RNA pseudouridine synthase [Phycisphaerales bacterium]
MIPVLFENEDIIAVNKPEGLASIPERAEEKKNVLALLSARYAGKVYIVHRLDKEASGVLLFAKNAAAHRHLNDQFSSRAVEKTYIALVHGRMDKDQGVIEKPLRQFGSGRMSVDTERGKYSVTDFHVRERFDLYTLIDAHPATGRRHQLRVHFYSIGHPIVGDPLYGDRSVQSSFARMMLHARKITCRLLSGNDVTIKAPTPKTFATVLKTHTR